MNRKLYLFYILIILLSGCFGRYTPPVLKVPFENGPPVPDYSLESSWSALPTIKDSADRVPASSGQIDLQNDALVDVFFIHPTSYLKTTSISTGWNANISDSAINLETDKGAVLNQASIFNGAGKIYAPRYLQAFIYSYYTPEKDKSEAAFELAYKDVRNAFIYYLEHYNQGRPFIIASHSQGTTHAIRILKEFIDGKELSQKMVAAYLVGMDVYDTLYTDLKQCENSDETGCYVTWRTYARGYYPPGYVKPFRETVCTNPLTWETNHNYASRELNKGGVLRHFDKVIYKLSDAQVEDGVLRINRPHFRGRIFFYFKNYHIVDYNLFYFNIRENAINRVQQYFKKSPKIN